MPPGHGRGRRLPALALSGALVLTLVFSASALVGPLETSGSTGSRPGLADPGAGTRAAPSALTLSPKSATNTAGQQHCLTATARDDAQNPSADVSVVFTVSGANSTRGTRVTGATGFATFCYTGTRAGTDIITAFADTDGSGTRTGAEPTDSATKTWRAAAPATLTLAPATAMAPPKTEHCVTATVRDSFGNPVQSLTVRFSVTGTHAASGQQATSAVGRASFCYTGTRAGNDTIRAFADTDGGGTQNGTEPGDTASKTWRAGPPATLSLTPPTAASPAGAEHCVSADVRDSLGNPNSDVSVRFSVAGTNTAQGNQTTGSNGFAAFCYTGRKAGADTIRAFADTDASGSQNGSEPGDSATHTYRAASPATLALVPPTATKVAGSEHCLTAEVRDPFGNATPDIRVRFSVTGANARSGTPTTGPLGRATFCYTGTKAGADTIRAFADTDGSGAQNGGEPADSATNTYSSAAPASLALSPQSGTSKAGVQHCVTAQVDDSFGNPTPDRSVRFSVSGANTGSGTQTTGPLGRATFCYTGTKAGADTIAAFADTDGSGAQNGNEPRDTAAETYRAAAPSSLVLTPVTATNVAGTEHCVTAEVKDSFGNATPDIIVRFSVTGANTGGGTQTTGPLGRATFCDTGTKAGADTIRAFADTDGSGARNGSEPADAATHRYSSARPASLALTPASDTKDAGVEHCVTAAVRDAFGNANPAVTVRFSVTGPNSAGGPRTTGPLGQAVFCYTGTKAGTDTIRAFADTDGSGTQNAGEPADAATEAHVAAAPARLSLTPASAGGVAGTEHCVTAAVSDAFSNPNPAASVRFLVTGANTAGGPRTTGPLGEATFCYTGTKTGTDTVSAFADTDGNGVRNGGEPVDSAARTYTPAAPAGLTLTPAAHTSTAGAEHCLAATVRDEFGNANPGVTVRLSVTGANTAGGSRPTGLQGQTTFCYTGTKAGTDAVSAFADTDRNGTQNGTEPMGSATSTYVAAAPAALTLVPPAASKTAGSEHCLTASVRDTFGNPNRGTTVRFRVTGANTGGGPALTDAAGDARFCYTARRAGAEGISAFADTDGSGVQNGTEPSDSATKTTVAAAPAALVLAPQGATGTAGTQHCVTAAVKDAFQNPTPSISVVFSVSRANTGGGSIQTGPAGQARFCYTGTKAGTDTISAFADTDASGAQNGVEPGDSATKTYAAGAPATLALSPQGTTRKAGEEQCVTATARDAFGNPPAGVSIRFAVTGANAANGSQATTAGGWATFCYTGTKAGADTVSAFADTDGSGTQNGSEPDATATRSYVAAAPATLSLTPPTGAKPAGTEHCVTATVRDRFGNPAAFVTVRFSVTGANAATGPRTTDIAGQADFCYTGAKAGADTVAAFADTDRDGTADAGEPQDATARTYVAAAPASLVLSAPAGAKPAGTERCFTATVRDAFANPVPNVIVRFSATGANTANGQKATATSGQSDFCYTGTKAGTDTVRAFADTDAGGTQNGGEPGDSLTRTYVAAAASELTLVPATGQSTAGTQHCVNVTVKDAFGNLVRNVTVRFSVSGANSTGGHQATGVTGRANFCYTGTKAGTDTISAFADTDANGTRNGSEPGDSASQTYDAAAPATLALTAPTGAKPAGTERCFTATVEDAFGNPVRNVTVRFSVTGANTTGGQDATSTTGTAGFCYTGTGAGTDTISAFADTDGNGTRNGSEPSDSLTRSYVAAAPSELTLAPATAQSAAGTQHCVTATVRDRFGNLVRGVMVRFSVTGANTASGDQATGVTGRAGFCYTGTSAGADTISAFADTDGSGAQNGSEPSATADHTYVPAAPAALALSPASATNTAGVQHCVTASVEDAFGNLVRGVNVRFSVAGANTAAGQQATAADGQAGFCYTGTSAGADTITAFADTDDSGARNGAEPEDSAVNTYVAAAPSKLTLAPAAGTGPAGTEHCVTATVEDEFGNPVGDVRVPFSVTGVNTATGQQSTGADGKAAFCYTGASTGTDTITAFADTDASGVRDGTEPEGSATNIYVAP